MPSTDTTSLPTYQGWTNYPTWAVFDYLTRKAAGYIKHEAEQWRAASLEHRVADCEQFAQFGLADTLKERLASTADDDYGLIGWALGHVDWELVAGNVLLEDDRRRSSARPEVARVEHLD
jgi:hypothetical protein